MPLGTAFGDLTTAMQALGFSCARRGAVLLELNGRLGNVLVNVGRYC